MTSSVPFSQLREQATALRLAGKSLREIKEITGVAAWTRRPGARDDLRDEARRLRARGYTYLEIVGELGVSKSSVSLWTRDMPRVGRISDEEIRHRKSARASAYWALNHLDAN